METFRIRAIPDADSCTLTLTGEVDLAVAPDLVELGTVSIGEPTTRTLFIDLEAVTFIDSTGIGALVQLHNVAEAADKRLTLSHVPARVRQVLTISGLGDFFLIEDERPRADSSA
jgi:anti-sigma B factor antagonist